MQPLVVHHPAYVAPLPAGHRFPMPKFGALFRRLVESGLAPEARCRVPEPASAALLRRAHDAAYVADVLHRRLAPEAVRRLGLPLSAEVVRRSRSAVAGTVLTARLALEHGLACNTAGGSHHAFQDAGAGFCVFNDVAVAAAVLLAEGSVRRILVIDLDVHQGDGTALIFQDEPRVMTLSVHCRTNFPVRKQQSTRDVAVDPDLGDRDYLGLVRPVVERALDRFAPDLVFYNAGVDPHRDDRLGHLALTDDGLAARERTVLAVALDRGVPVVGIIGGGYDRDLDRLARRHGILHRTAAALMPG